MRGFKWEIGNGREIPNFQKAQNPFGRLLHPFLTSSRLRRDSPLRSSTFTPVFPLRSSVASIGTPLSAAPPPRRWSAIPLCCSTAGTPPSASTAHRCQPPVDISSVAGRLLPASASTAAAGHRMASYDEDSSQIAISEEEKDKLVAEVIRTILFKMHQSSGCPIKRDELTQLITKNYRQRSLPAFIINEARNKLASIFGYEMKELQRCRPSSTKQGRSSQQSVGEIKSYIILSKLPADIYSKFVENKETSHITGFTFAVVSVVHLAGGKISEENLWHHLRRLGLNENDGNHPLFGHLKQALESLVQQRYLQKEKCNDPEGNSFMYELAERALDESFSEKLKDYIAQIASKDAANAEVDD
ncbi:hypothetical protein Taro_005054 [Colocasia esculenta]|uniref:MAGE domain-containing protein n=1 Tax=Colocasia esculenta TaxID=4460 RepID=A0A843TNY7_COLES|nr:hypothetical protein [Colocasia esculenta]